MYFYILHSFKDYLILMTLPIPGVPLSLLQFRLRFYSIGTIYRSSSVRPPSPDGLFFKNSSAST